MQIIPQNHFKSWWSLLNTSREFVDNLIRVVDFIKQEYKTKTILPYKQNVFRAFREVELDDCKYVLLGMDPFPNIYKNEPSACGLSFVTENGFTNPSLRILSTCLNIDPNDFKSHVLDKQCLMLNSALTLELGISGSHLKQWKPFTKALITTISKHRPDITWILLGADAAKFSEFIVSDNYLKAPHPMAYVYKGDKEYLELKELFKKIEWIK